MAARETSSTDCCLAAVVNSPTFGEARPVWRPTGDVETYTPPGMSAAERLARARQAGAPAPQPAVTLESPRRRRHNGSAAPAQREAERADLTHLPAPPPRPAPPPPAEKRAEKPAGNPAGKPPDAARRPAKPRAPGTGASDAIRDVLTQAGRPMTPGEIIAALPARWKPQTIYWLLPQLRARGELVQDVRRGPYRTPQMAAMAIPPAAPSVRARVRGPHQSVAQRQAQVVRVLAGLPGPVTARTLLDALLAERGEQERTVDRMNLYNDLRALEGRGEVHRHRARPADTWSVPDEAPAPDAPNDAHANLGRLVAQLRRERDELARELAACRNELAAAAHRLRAAGARA